MHKAIVEHVPHVHPNPFETSMPTITEGKYIYFQLKFIVFALFYFVSVCLPTPLADLRQFTGNKCSANTHLISNIKCEYICFIDEFTGKNHTSPDELVMCAPMLQFIGKPPTLNHLSNACLKQYYSNRQKVH